MVFWATHRSWTPRGSPSWPSLRPQNDWKASRTRKFRVRGPTYAKISSTRAHSRKENHTKSLQTHASAISHCEILSPKLFLVAWPIQNKRLLRSRQPISKIMILLERVNQNHCQGALKLRMQLIRSKQKNCKNKPKCSLRHHDKASSRSMYM